MFLSTFYLNDKAFSWIQALSLGRFLTEHTVPQVRAPEVNENRHLSLKESSDNIPLV